MCLRADLRRVAICLLLAWSMAAPARADDVALFLQTHRLDELLALHLEQKLEAAATPEEKDLLVTQLAGLYARLLESVDDAARRVVLEDRSRELLADAPAESAASLRLALLRGSYRSAEKIAENHRLRAADETDIEAAKATLTEILPDLRRLEQQLADRVDAYNRQLSRVSGNDALLLTQRTEAAKGHLAQCRFIRAWALYYQSWLEQRRDNAIVAEPIFSRLLDAENAYLEADQVSEDLRGIEPIARAVLGMALCKSLTASTATALAWAALLEHEQTHATVRAQAPIWTLAILLENGEYRAARGFLRDMDADGDEAVPLAWLRLIAVHGLEGPVRDPDARALVDYAVDELASRNELRQILDLADRYGAEALGSSGFALRYIRGVQHYDAARTAHGGDAPTYDEAAMELYRRATEAFIAALDERDADAYPRAAASAGRLIAWCSYFRGKYLDARKAFEVAAGDGDDEQASEALWMAIVCLDQVVRSGAERQGELDDLIVRFLETFPASRHAPQLLLRLAADADDPSAQMVQRLLAIPEHSSSYEDARRRAAHMLYRLFRLAGPGERETIASEYLAVAGPIVVAEGSGIDGADEQAVRDWLVRGRRLLEVALAEGVERRVAAEQVLAAMDELATRRPEALAAHQDELDYRRLRFALLGADPAAAAELADALWARAPESAWARKAARDLFRQAHATLEDGRPDRVAAKAAREDVVRFGERILAEYEDDPAALSRPGVLSYYDAVAEAAAQLHADGGDPALGRRAYALYAERLLPERPDSRRFLRAAGLLGAEFGSLEAALDCWRRLVTGSEIDSDAWYEARFHVIWLLSRLDPERAREVMKQHRQLHPDYGPPPWGPRLEGLNDRLLDMETETPSTPGAPGATEGGDP